MTGREVRGIYRQIDKAILSTEEAQALLDEMNLNGVGGLKDEAFISGCIYMTLGALEGLREAVSERAQEQPSHS
jgi:hypothetical protein